MQRLLLLFLWMVIVCLQVVPEIPHQFESEYSMQVSFSEDSFLTELVPDVSSINDGHNDSATTFSGTYHYNYDIQRSLIQLNRANHFPISVSKLNAYDIDNTFITNRGDGKCVNSILSAPMNYLFAWSNETSSPFPKHAVSFINQTDILLPTGNSMGCNLWVLHYLGGCGPTVPPPCTINEYLCATNDNLPVMLRIDDTENGSSLTQYFWDVNVTEQKSEKFEIPADCGAYPYPVDPPFGLEDHFENGEVASFWIPCGKEYSRWECGHIYAQTEIVRSGSYAANITVQAGDISQPDQESSTERDELDTRPWTIGDQDIWYGMSFYLPYNFPIVTDRLVLGQWKQDFAGDKHPLMAQRFVNNTWYYTIDVGTTKERYNMEPLELGVWHDMIYNIRFSSNGDGYFRTWHNGTLVIDYKGRTSYSYMPPTFYFKFGLYRDSWPTSFSVFFDNFSIGKSYDAVNPASEEG